MLVIVDIIVAVTVAFFLGRYHQWRKRAHPQLPLPPGPKGIPLLSNLLQIPAKSPWITYTKWGQQFNSDVIYVSYPGTSMVVLNSWEAAFDLCERRSSIYSDRPWLPMISELVDLPHWSFALMRYGDKWRNVRKLFHKYFHPQAVIAFRPHEIRAAHALLRRLLATPEDFAQHLRAATGETILDLTYAIKIQGSNDPWVRLAEAANEGVVTAGAPGAFLVDLLPFLKWAPDWFPGAGFKRKAAHWRTLNDRMFQGPFDTVKEKLQRGEAVPDSVTSSILAAAGDAGLDPYSEYIAKCATGIMYSAASDTTVSIMKTLFLAMTLYPEVQREAHDQLDAVLGGKRLPEASDQPALPYITALVKELQRWHPPLPIGVPHCSTEDDVYRSYFIPAGSFIICNAWAMSRDPRHYPNNPDAFDPSRFLTKSGQLNPSAKDPAYTFGFGRRICAGRYMALESMWILVASVLAAFAISKADGDEKGPEERYTSTLVTSTMPFTCKIRPRSQASEGLIRATTMAEE